MMDSEVITGTTSKELTEIARNSPGGVYYMGIQRNNEREELQRIELAARTCYKSEDNIQGDSSIRLFRTLAHSGHYAMLRFGERSVILERDFWKYKMLPIIEKGQQASFWRCVKLEDDGELVAVTANLQGWLFLAYLIRSMLVARELFDMKVPVLLTNIFKDWPEMSWLIGSALDEYITMYNAAHPIYWKDISFEDLIKKEEFSPIRRHTFRVVTDRGITHEIVRHTTLSYAQESTRWINYGNRTTQEFIDNMVWIPEHMKDHDAFDPTDQESYQNVMNFAYSVYNFWKNKGMVSGDARNFLPHCLKTEIVVSGYLDESPFGKIFNQGFSHFIDMRIAKDAHKGIQPIAREMSKYLGYKTLVN